MRSMTSIGMVAFALSVFALTPTASALRGQEGETVSVDDPRPLSSAIEVIEQRCHCAITYEDPRWTPEDVADIPGSVSHRADVRVRVPKGGRFTFSIGRNLASRTPAQVRASVEELVHTFEQSGTGRGSFQLVGNSPALHVVPRSGSILDVSITIPGGTRPVADLVVTILSQVGDAAGARVGLATFPVNLFKREVAFEAQHEPAERTLTRLLLATQRRLSWRLYYDVTMGQYYLGIHLVP